jgi:hypothetical protein
MYSRQYRWSRQLLKKINIPDDSGWHPLEPYGSVIAYYNTPCLKVKS